MAENSKPERKSVGRPFQKGTSGNPGGRPAATTALTRALEGDWNDVHKRLVELLHSDDEKVALESAKFMCDHIKGKPTQAITGEEGGPLKVDLGMVEMLRKLAAP